MLGVFLLCSFAYAQETIRIGGTGAALGTMRHIASAFGKSNPDIRIAILPSMGSSGGIKAVMKGALDIGLSGRQLQGEELTRGISASEYARTPFVLVTGKKELASGLTSSELIRIYRGERSTWPNGEKIRLVLRPVSDVDTTLIKGISEEMSSAFDEAHAREGMLIGLTDQENADILEETPGAVGFSALSLILSEKRKLKILSFNNVTPGIKTLENRSYPLAKSLFLITRATPSAPVQRFVKFLRSAEGRRILKETGNIPALSEARK